MSHLEVKVINIYSCREVRVQQQGSGPAVQVPVIVHFAEVPSSLHRGSLHPYLMPWQHKVRTHIPPSLHGLHPQDMPPLVVCVPASDIFLTHT